VILKGGLELIEFLLITLPLGGHPHQVILEMRALRHVVGPGNARWLNGDGSRDLLAGFPLDARDLALELSESL